jgi:integrase
MPVDELIPVPDNRNPSPVLRLPEPRIWGPMHLAEFLGVTKHWVYKHTQKEAIDPVPHIKGVVGRLRFDTASPAFQQWLQRQQVNEPADIATTDAQRIQRRKLISRRKTYQQGNVQLHNSRWTLRYREFDHATRTWMTRRAILEKARDRKDALKAAAPILARVNRSNNRQHRAPDDRLTFKDFVEDYWKPYATRKDLQVSTLDHHNSFLETHLFPFFGDFPMQEVQPSDISRFLLEKTNSQENYSANTLRSFYQFLRVIFDLAEQNDVINKSPVRAKLHKPEKLSVDKPTLTAAQIREVLLHLPDDQERLFMLLLAVTGMRVGEGLALRWMDFNPQANQLSINHTLYRGKLKEPKTKGSKAKLRLAPQIVDLLLAHQATSSFRQLDDFIFCRADSAPLEATSLRHHLYKAIDKMGIQRVKGKYGLHIFRHSAGTLLYEKSRDMKLVQGTLRHSDVSTTSDIYVHLGDEVLGEGSKILATEIMVVRDEHKHSPKPNNIVAALNAGQLKQQSAATIAGHAESEPAVINAGEAIEESTAEDAGTTTMHSAAISQQSAIDQQNKQEGVESQCPQVM